MIQYRNVSVYKHIIEILRQPELTIPLCLKMSFVRKISVFHAFFIVGKWFTLLRSGKCIPIDPVFTVSNLYAPLLCNKPTLNEVKCVAYCTYDDAIESKLKIANF